MRYQCAYLLQRSVTRVHQSILWSVSLAAAQARNHLSGGNRCLFTALALRPYGIGIAERMRYQNNVNTMSECMIAYLLQHECINDNSLSDLSHWIECGYHNVSAVT